MALIVIDTRLGPSTPPLNIFPRRIDRLKLEGLLVILTLALLLSMSLAPAALNSIPVMPPLMAKAAPQLKLTKVSPPPNAVGVARQPIIELSFNDSVSTGSLHGFEFQVMGRWSGPCRGHFLSNIKGNVVRFYPEQPFSAGELVTVSLSKFVKSSGGRFLNRPYTWTFWVEASPGSMNFQATQILVPENTPYGAHGADLNGDGWLDLAVPNENSWTLSVFMNLAGASFSQDATYDVGNHCSPIEGADFNLDGVLDLAVSNIHANDISVLFGRGNGSFDPQMRVPAGGGSPRGLVVLDFNGDGMTDMATANRNGDTISLLSNVGAGHFSLVSTFDAGVSGETGLCATDMNNDGLTDLVVVGYLSHEVSVFLGNGNAGFQQSAVRFCGRLPWGVVCGDVNGDGNVDVGAVASGDGVVAIMFGNGQGSLSSATFYPVGQFPVALDFGELNGDGSLDLTASSFDDGIYTIYENDGQGNFINPSTLPALNTGSCTVLHDIDNDGDVDISAIDEVADLLYIFRQQ